VLGRFAPVGDGTWVTVGQPARLDEELLAVVRGFIRPGGRGLGNAIRCAEAVYRQIVRSGGVESDAPGPDLPFDTEGNPLDALAAAWAASDTPPDEAERTRARALTNQPRIVDALVSVVIARNAGQMKLSAAYRRIAAVMIETMALRAAVGSTRRDLDEIAEHLEEMWAAGRHPPEPRALFQTLRLEAKAAHGPAQAGDAELERLVQRIQGLRAKTVEQGCTEQEALAAAEKVAELLDRYGLTLSELDLRRQACEGIGIETGRKRRGPIDDCIPHIAQFFDCRAWAEHTASGTLRYIFFGMKSDVQAALYLHDLIVLAFATETAAFQAGAFYQDAHSSQRRTATNSFQIGLAGGIIGKLDALRRARDDARRGGSGRDLVPIKDSIIDAELARLGLMTRRAGGNRRRVIRDAYAAGQEAGARFEYQPGIGQG
jgi:Protein of unknown function (DUF2786)